MTEGSTLVLVLEAILIQLALHTRLHAPRINRVFIATAIGLSGKAIHHRFDGIGLIGLGFEFEFHAVLFNWTASI